MMENYLELISSGIIVLSCLFIIFRTKKIYNLTSHKGIGAFRSAFFYWAIAYSVRIIATINLAADFNYVINILSGLLFFYALSMAGFSLVYSLVWKNLTRNRNSLLHIISIIIAFVNMFYVANLMFYTQLAVLLYGIHVSYHNYKKSGQKHKFLQLYFIGLILAFAGYLVNFLSDLFTSHYKYISYYSHSITICVFLIFVYGVTKVLKK